MAARKREVSLFIDGRFEPSRSGETFDSINPATEDAFAAVALADAGDVARAVEAARKAFDEGPWPRMTAAERAGYLHAVADALEENVETLGALESIDTGLPIAFTADGHATRAVRHFRYFAEEAERIGGTTLPLDDAYLHIMTREPVGVAAIIAPWNAPLGLATLGAAAALTCGNTCVIKPSELSPVTTTELAKIVAELDLPPGVLNVVHGPGRPTGEALAAHPGVDAIAFTGSSATGRRIMESAGRGLKRFVGELGGKAPTLVFADADLDRAIEGTLLCAFANNGEACVAGSRILVERSLFGAFVERFAARAARIVVGDPMKIETEVGPVISAGHHGRLLELIASAGEGAELRCGGGRPAHLAKGYYLSPTVIAGASPRSRLVQEEILGPVVTISAFEDEEDAVRIANDTPYGLAAYVWSAGMERVFRVSRRLRVGTVWANTPLVRDIRVPFGGYKQSGVGRLGGQYSIDSFTEVKNTCISVNPYSFPPFGGG